MPLHQSLDSVAPHLWIPLSTSNQPINTELELELAVFECVDHWPDTDVLDERVGT